MMTMKIVLEAIVPDDFDRCNLCREYILPTQDHYLHAIKATTRIHDIERSLIDPPKKTQP